VSFGIHAQKITVDFQPNKVKLRASKTFTLEYYITNRGDKPIRLTQHLDVPPYWRVRSELKELEIGARDQLFLSVKVKPPDFIPKGEFPINIILYDQKSTLVASNSFLFNNKSVKTEIRFASVAENDYVSRGKQYTIPVSILNKGITPVLVVHKVIKHRDWDVLKPLDNHYIAGKKNVDDHIKLTIDKEAEIGRHKMFIYLMNRLDITNVLARKQINFYVADENIEVKVVQNSKEAVSGKTKTIVVKIQNHSNKEYRLKSQLNLPQGWKLTRPNFPFTLAPNASTIRVLTMSIPRYQQDGEYKLRYLLYDHRKTYINTTVVKLRVKKRQEIDFKLVDVPPIVSAGDTITLKYQLKNMGNHTELIQINSHRNTKGLKQHTLAAGKSINGEVKLKTDSHLWKDEDIDLVVKARIANTDSLIESTLFGTTKVISNNRLNTNYNLFPVNVSLGYVGRNNNDTYKNGYQLSLHAEGALDEQRKQNLTLSMNTPDEVDISVFTRFSQYYAQYENDYFRLELGDKNFTSTYLSSPGRLGTGAEIGLYIRDVEIGGFYNEPRFFKDIKRTANIYTTYHIDRDKYVKYGLLMKEHQNTKSQIHSLEAKYNYKGYTRFTSELSYSKTDNRQEDGLAVRFENQTVIGSINMQADYIWANTFFDGFISNTDQINSSISWNVIGGLSLEGNSQFTALNISRDTVLFIPPSSRRFQVGLSYSYMQGSFVRLLTGRYKSTSRNEQTRFDFDERTYRAILQQQIGEYIGITFEAEQGKVNNFLTNTIGTTAIYRLNMKFNILGSNIDAFANYWETDRFGLKEFNQLIYGGAISGGFSEKVHYTLTARSSFSPEEQFRNRNLFQLSLRYLFNPSHYLSLISLYTLERNQATFSNYAFTLNYTMRLDVPISRKSKTSELRARIRRESKARLRGVRFKMNNSESITNDKGLFRFGGLQEGNQLLSIDKSSLDPNEVTVQRFPQLIHIDSAVVYHQVDIVKGGKIEGILHFENRDKRYNPKLARDEFVILTLTKSDRKIQKLVYLGKPFVFSDLVPGIWTLSVNRENLDKYFTLDEDFIKLLVMPDQSKKITLKVTRIPKWVKFQQTTFKIKG